MQKLLWNSVPVPACNCPEMLQPGMSRMCNARVIYAVTDGLLPGSRQAVSQVKKCGVAHIESDLAAAGP